MAEAAPAPVAQTSGITTPTPPTQNGAAPPSGPNGAKVDAAPTEAEQTFELQVDSGTKRKVTLTELKKLAMKSGYADKITQQTKDALRTIKQREAELQQKLAAFKSDPDSFMREQGIDPDEFAHSKLRRKLAEAEMTPEQRQLEERRLENEELKKKLQAFDEEKKTARLNEATERAKARISTELDTAWERAGFERGAESFFAVYEVMNEWKELGLLPKQAEFSAAHADRIIEQAKANLEGVDKRREAAVLKGLKGKSLYDRLGKSVVDELNRYQIELFRGGKKTTDVTPPPRAGTASSSGYITPSEAAEQIRKMGK